MVHLHSTLLKDPSTELWWHFSDPIQVIEVSDRKEVLSGLATISDYVNQGYYSAGFLSYEAAAAFDPAYQTQALDQDFPLVWFGIYPKPTLLSFSDLIQLKSIDCYKIGEWSPTVRREEFVQVIHHLKAYIALGETYQTNYTFRLRADFEGDAWAYFLNRIPSQPQSYAAFIQLGQHRIASLSPELFFRQQQHLVITRPMKGTIQRGSSLQQDHQYAQMLRSSVKNQAENLMIVDMIRNDLGRIAEIGRVDVTHLFQIECHPTLWQMTSTIQARVLQSPTEVLKALFPCASITGAPKIRTMQLIQSLETDPRRIYTGAIGYVTPFQEAQFSVAIRTLLIDCHRQTAEYGVGSGIVWDSQPEEEYEECLSKARILTYR
jgi:para-aminobenzoate synthetase/4-amino-4-deoxychorismate lyase